MSETYYRTCPDGCDEGNVPVYGFNGLQVGEEPCETCLGSGYVPLPAGAVVVDAATAATAAEACAYAADVDDEQAAARDKLRGEQGEEYRASARRYRAAAAELREGGQR